MYVLIYNCPTISMIVCKDFNNQARSAVQAYVYRIKCLSSIFRKLMFLLCV